MDDLARALLDDGFCILRGLLPLDLIDALHAAHAPLLEAARSRPESANRGPMRWYLDVPFITPFADPRVFENPAVLALVEAALGPDPLLLHIGTDTPVLGSETQGLHADTAPLFPELDPPPPAHAIAVNIPLVDVTEANGPLEIARGTHRLHQEAAIRAVAAGTASLERVYLARGDVLVRDPRVLHCGTANPSAEPRVVMVVAYQRPWYRHGDTPRIAIAAEHRVPLTRRAERLLRLHLGSGTPIAG